MIWNSTPLSCGSMISKDLQVHALGVAAAYIQSRDASAIAGLTVPSCPGKGAAFNIHEQVSALHVHVICVMCS